MKSITLEADEIVSGDRNADYGHPLENFTETAEIWQSILGRKLKGTITAEDVGLCMIALKLARQMNKPKRDNLVDIAGYAKTLDMIAAKRQEIEAPF